MVYSDCFDDELVYQGAVSWTFVFAVYQFLPNVPLSSAIYLYSLANRVLVLRFSRLQTYQLFEVYLSWSLLFFNHDGSNFFPSYKWGRGD